MTGRGVLVALILAATAAFVVGVGLERHDTHNEAAETPAQRAAEGKRGKEALEAIGQAYRRQLEQDRSRLRAQMNAYVACDDPEIRDVVRAGFGDLVAYVRRVSGADWPTVWGFFATGMLLNVLASMHVDDDPETWMTDLLSGSGKAI